MYLGEIQNESLWPFNQKNPTFLSGAGKVQDETSIPEGRKCSEWMETPQKNMVASLNEFALSKCTI